MRKQKSLAMCLSKKTFFLAGLPLIISLGATEALSLEVREGKWGITTETNTPMSPEPQIEYIEECLAGDFDPMAELMQQDLADCEILSSDDTATRLEITLQCNIEGVGNVDGNILFVSNDTAANGQVEMVMNMAGMSMSMSSKWDGEYLGSCSQ